MATDAASVAISFSKQLFVQMNGSVIHALLSQQQVQHLGLIEFGTLLIDSHTILCLIGVPGFVCNVGS